MKRKLILLLILTFCLFFTLSAYAEKSNPIDTAFAESFQKATSTAQQRYVASEYWDAWKSELNNLALQLKNQYKYDRDKEKVDEYIDATEKFASALSSLEWINWSDFNEPPGETRVFGTGAPGAAVLAEASVYKNAFMRMLAIYENFSDPGIPYQYIYKAKK